MKINHPLGDQSRTVIYALVYESTIWSRGSGNTSITKLKPLETTVKPSEPGQLTGVAEVVDPVEVVLPVEEVNPVETLVPVDLSEVVEVAEVDTEDDVTYVLFL